MLKYHFYPLRRLLYKNRLEISSFSGIRPSPSDEMRYDGISCDAKKFVVPPVKYRLENTHRSAGATPLPPRCRYGGQRRWIGGLYRKTASAAPSRILPQMNRQINAYTMRSNFHELLMKRDARLREITSSINKALESAPYLNGRHGIKFNSYHRN